MPHPIVFVHGLLGFGRVEVAGMGVDYFRGVPDALRRAGHVTPPPFSLPKADCVAKRAETLAHYVDTLPETAGRRFHLIAHSMGGLDSRHLISHIDGFAERVISLTTVGTPHRGTALAELVPKGLPSALAALAIKIPVGAFHDLTREACRARNETTLDQPGVRYFSIAGAVNATALPPSALLAPSLLLKQYVPEPNDGMVSVSSARWGESFELWEGFDHINLINWATSAKDNVIGRYLDIADRLSRLE